MKDIVLSLQISAHGSRQKGVASPTPRASHRQAHCFLFWNRISAIFPRIPGTCSHLLEQLSTGEAQVRPLTSEATVASIINHTDDIKPEL